MKKIICVAVAFFLFGFEPVLARNDIIMTIGQTGNYGVWGPWDYCPQGSYAIGYSMKVEIGQGGGNWVKDAFSKGQIDDDTAVNGIKLICVDKHTMALVRYVTSNIGEYGQWKEEKFCQNSFLKSVQFKSEEPQGEGDDTATNSVRFICSNGQEIEANGSMPWGSWGPYYSCPGTSVICGIQTQVEGPVGSEDDTGLNGANFVCCPLLP
jgi:hypothetical protein